jgi:hypothetical protein
MKPSAALSDWHIALPLARMIYERHGAGCCWHIVLDDQNIDDDDVEFCAGEAAANAHKDCVALIPMMRLASRSQRLKLAAAI